ncbi:hypothetical protein KP509_09G095900 [Ceratopteris richardii]|uniref:Uncharacterized protein n=1 Tax=Ceratopteris richardii TaxID=49495 RepID=A0A8T2UD30_CERRI|nr:hypothetical protein KP509_09G095900 [Ceratopteris richardii]
MMMHSLYSASSKASSCACLSLSTSFLLHPCQPLRRRTILSMPVDLLVLLMHMLFFSFSSMGAVQMSTCLCYEKNNEDTESSSCIIIECENRIYCHTQLLSRFYAFTRKQQTSKHSSPSLSTIRNFVSVMKL